MSRSKNKEKEYGPVYAEAMHIKSSDCDDSKAIKKAKFALKKSRSWGQTDRILRRNRKLWARKYAKALRRIDKTVIEQGVKELDSQEK